MKLNWKVRFQNVAFVVPFAAALLGLVYQILGMFGVVAPISEDAVMQIVTLVINVLVAAGILIDPTTPGICDSERALTYTTPGCK